MHYTASLYSILIHSAELYSTARQTKKVNKISDRSVQQAGHSGFIQRCIVCTSWPRQQSGLEQSQQIPCPNYSVLCGSKRKSPPSGLKRLDYNKRNSYCFPFIQCFVYVQGNPHLVYSRQQSGSISLFSLFSVLCLLSESLTSWTLDNCLGYKKE